MNDTVHRRIINAWCMYDWANYGSMTPKTKTAEFFGFFNIVGKFSAILGPALFALIGRLFGESRWSIISLIVFFVVGMILLSFVDVQKGVEAAQATTA